jgi:beta-glucosidase
MKPQAGIRGAGDQINNMSELIEDFYRPYYSKRYSETTISRCGRQRIWPYHLSMRTVIAGMWLTVASVTFAAAAAVDSQDPDARASKTESQMTDPERFQLLHSIAVLPIPLPGMPRLPEGIPITAGYIKGIARLGVPDILETDASLGVVNPFQLRAGDVATAMPSGLALASSFDPELAYRSGVTIGSEARAKGFNVLLGGGANLARDPRNGRNFEYLGEDPLLAGTLAGEAIRGTQTQGVVSTVKHFALNDQETQRHTLNARISEAALRESDLLAFEIAIERGQPASVMCAYNRLNGPYACGNDPLLNRVLKGDWGYKGFVMSDWGAVYDVDFILKGLDQQSGSQLDKQLWFDAPLQARVSEGVVPRARISEAVRRILRSLYAVGADRPAVPTSIDYVAHATVARQAAAEGIVLLKNDGALPLAAQNQKIALIGGHANIGVLSGGGSSQVTPYGGASTIIPLGGPGLEGILIRELFMPSSPLNALKAALPGAQITYYNGYDAEASAAVAAHADTVIVFATQWQGEANDHASMSLPEGQDELINAVAKANPNTVVVLETGNPVKMPWLNSVKAVVEAWYPGEAGGSAIVDVLTGAVNPSGHLPISFPVDEAQLPRPSIPGLGLADLTPIDVDYAEGANVGYRWYAAQHLQPLFPFGMGLSYTRFEFGGLRLSGGKTVEASFTVRNTGARAGVAVPQLYLMSAAGAPLQRLAAFSRITLEAGQSQSVRVQIDPRLLAHWDVDRHGWQIDRGSYVFALGTSASDLGEHAELALAAKWTKP